MHTPKETNHKIITKGNIFSFVLENDVGESMFFSVHKKNFFNNNFNKNLFNKNQFM